MLPAQEPGGRYKSNSFTLEGFVAAGPAIPDRAYFSSDSHASAGVDTRQNRIRISGCGLYEERAPRLPDGQVLEARQNFDPAKIEMEGNGQHESALPAKNLFRIGEVSRLTGTKQFVLRYWESEFPTLQPVKSPKGHRLYRREGIETVFVVKRLLYDEGFTIAGARRHLRDQGAEPNGSSGRSAATGAGP